MEAGSKCCLSTGQFQRAAGERTKVSIMTTRPNHVLQRTRPSRPGCNPRVPRAESLGLGR